MKTKLAIALILFFTALISADKVQFERIDVTSPEAGIKTAIKKGAHWVGYHIPANSNTFSTHIHCSSHRYSGKTLHEYVYNTKPERKCCCGNAVFFELNGNSATSVKNVKVTGYHLTDEGFENTKVIWINSVTPAKSISYLKKLYNIKKGYDIRKQLVGAMGIHGQNKEVFSFLKKVVKSNDADKIRKNATFWIGCQKTPEAVTFLKNLVNSDDSFRIRKQAVFAISISKTKNLIPALLNIAENHKETGIRKSAIFWLGQQASKKIAKKLEGISENDPNYKIRRAAVFAISQHPEGVDSLLRIAKTSKHLDVKKKAIFWLSQKDDKRALEAIKTILEQ